MRWSLDDVPVLVAVVEEMGISAAAARLGVSKSHVSKTLTRLEEALGTRLVERNTRRLRITDTGEAFYRQAKRILEEALAADALMSGLAAKPVGRLAAAVPPAFAREILAPALPGFHTAYPEIALELKVTSQPVDLLRDEIDVAVLVGALENSEYISRTLYAGKLIWVASPGYARQNDLSGQNAKPSAHIKICETRYAGRDIPLRDKGLAGRLTLPRNVTLADDPVTVRRAVQHGLGVSFLPDQYCKPYLRDGLLVEVFPDIAFHEQASVLSAVYPSRRLLAPKTRAFLDFLSEICRKL